MQFEPKFDIIDLPSEGMFYSNGCNKVKVYHLTLADEEIMSAPNLLQSGEMLDKLLERKVVRVDDDAPFIHPSKMLIGDRLAVLVFLRVTMDNIYKILVDGQPYEFDLATLKVKEITAKPNAKMEFDFKLPKSGDMLTFRLMTGDDEKDIRLYQLKTNQILPFSKVIRLEKLITSVNGETDKILISTFVKQMNIMDANKLLKYMNDVTPSLDLEIDVISPVTNKPKKQYLELTSEFFFPNI